ncbi:putative ubiquitin carboxyl-terminal hydrolase 2 [[Candida] railenensis]|uniref:Ubiquitin carboxyl-terminal hydrolase n=1 Tax=[Candida] railenensis TaxID=45579 RepID=A0A9P0QUF0_9ASCO|nr:putative ubiquitin carboxyl-terminal hydrolase 2 [[Candida] railenensis]
MSDSGWNTIHSDAGVFTELVEKLDISDIQFDDLYSIDKESLLESSPIYGVVFLFKYSKIDREYSGNGNRPLTGEYDVDYQEHGIFFANQTIQNACATQAVLNVLLNKSDQVDLGEELGNFKSFVTGFDSELCGETISNSDLIRKVHNSFSAPSSIIDEDKQKPPRGYDDKNDGLFHFIGYLQTNGFIYELDGLKRYPIKHVPCSSDQEFCEKLPGVIRERIAKYGEEELRFSLLSITNNKLKQYEESGEYDRFNSELMKRETWKRENELRKFDYTTLMIQLLKNVGKELNDEEWAKLIENGKKTGQEKLLASYFKKKQ